MLVEQGRFLITNAHVLNKPGTADIAVIRYPDLVGYNQLSEHHRTPYTGCLSGSYIYPDYEVDLESRRLHDIAVCGINWQDPSILPLKTVPLIKSSLSAKEGYKGYILPYATTGIFGDRSSERSILSTLAVFKIDKLTAKLAQSFMGLSEKTLTDIQNRVEESGDTNIYDTDDITFSPEHSDRLCALLSGGASGTPFVVKMTDGKIFMASVYKGKSFFGDMWEARMDVTLFTDEHLSWINRVFREAAVAKGKAKKNKGTKKSDK